MDAWPRTQTSTYYGMLCPGAVGSRNGCSFKPTAVGIFSDEQRMYRAVKIKTGSTSPFTLNRRESCQSRGREGGRGTQLFPALPSARYSSRCGSTR